MILVNDDVIIPERFPDGTFRLMNIPMSEYEDDKNIRFRWEFENNEEMILLYMLSKHYREHGRTVQYLDLPYVPNARMDRVKSQFEAFTLKYFCEFINSLNFTQVIVFDPHSQVTINLLDRCRVFTPERDIMVLMDRLILLEKVSHILYPDAGAMKRYSGGLPYHFLQGEKRRNWETGRIDGITIDIPEGDVVTGVLIVDDLCSYGGTFVAAFDCNGG